MLRSIHHPSLSVAALFLSFTACMFTQPTPDPGQFENRVATSVVLTLTALPTAAPPVTTSIPLPLPTPSPTEVLPPTPVPPTAILLPTLSPTTAPTSKPDYTCDIINQRPRDDFIFEPSQDFDIKWTLVNTGTLRWRSSTYLEYQSGPRMTDATLVELPRLMPGEQYNVIFDAAAPAKPGRQIMVWAVYWIDNKDTTHQICYPYVRILVER